MPTKAETASQPASQPDGRTDRQTERRTDRQNATEGQNAKEGQRQAGGRAGGRAGRQAGRQSFIHPLERHIYGSLPTQTSQLLKYKPSDTNRKKKEKVYACLCLNLNLVFLLQGWPYPDTVAVLIKDEEGYAVGLGRMSLGDSQLPVTLRVTVTSVPSTGKDSEEEGKPFYKTNVTLACLR